MAQAYCKTISEKDIFEFQYIVDGCVKRLLARGISAHIRDDLYQVGMIALMESLQRLEIQTASFESYLKIRVQGAMLDALRKEDWVPRSVRDRLKRIQHAKSYLQHSLNRKATHAELAQFMGCSVQEIHQILAIPQIDSIEYEKEEGVRRQIKANEASPQEQLLFKECIEQCLSVLDQLKGRERALIQAYYFQGKKHHEIAQMWGLTSPRVSQLHAQVRKKLFKRMTKKGILHAPTKRD